MDHLKDDSMSKKGIVDLLDSEGQVIARYKRLYVFGAMEKDRIYIENLTDEERMYRICKNGKPISFPIVGAGKGRIIYFQQGQNVRPGDEITVTEHLEEYIYDGTEND